MSVLIGTVTAYISPGDNRLRLGTIISYFVLYIYDLCFEMR